MRGLILKYAAHIDFVVPDYALQEATEQLPAILQRRGISLALGLAILDSLNALLHTIEAEAYAPLEAPARQRLARRDPDDWPILAAALLLECPIWTEDTDFFGCGVATWTTENVEIFLSKAPADT